jgi:hypothetical protein
MLKPRFHHLLFLSNEVASAICARMSELVGRETAVGVLSPFGSQISEEYTESLLKIFGIRGRNAMTCIFINRLAAEIFLKIKIKEHEFRAGYAEDRIYECPYAEGAKRYEERFTCEVCLKLAEGVARKIDRRIKARREKRISDGDEYCGVIYEVEKPPDGLHPISWRTRILKQIGKIYVNLTIHKIAVGHASKALSYFGKRMITLLGHDASLIPARGAEKAGEYLGRAFGEKLSLGNKKEDGMRLMQEIHLLFGRRAKRKGLSLSLRKCRFAEACGEEESRFVETACHYLFKGLASNFNLEFDLEKSRKNGCYKAKECRMFFNEKG